MVNPMTTLGDLIYADVGGVPLRLPIGVDVQFLVVIDGVPAWRTLTLTDYPDICRVPIPTGLVESVLVKRDDNSIEWADKVVGTPGSIPYINAEGAWALLTPGNEDDVLQIVDGLPTWAPIS